MKYNYSKATIHIYKNVTASPKNLANIPIPAPQLLKFSPPSHLLFLVSSPLLVEGEGGCFSMKNVNKCYNYKNKPNLTKCLPTEVLWSQIFEGFFQAKKRMAKYLVLLSVQMSSNYMNCHFAIVSIQNHYENF